MESDGKTWLLIAIYIGWYWGGIAMHEELNVLLGIDTGAEVLVAVLLWVFVIPCAFTMTLIGLDKEKT